MVRVTYEIPKDDYDKAVKEGADSIIGEHIHMSYGVYGSAVYESEGKYYLSYTRGDSCD